MAAYETAAVATDQAMASKIGAHVLREMNGTAADAAVAVALSLGVINFQSSGLGGGGFLVYYDNSAKESTAINFREKAPSGAYDSMYDDVAERPALLVGVPGELKGPGKNTDESNGRNCSTWPRTSPRRDSPSPIGPNAL